MFQPLTSGQQLLWNAVSEKAFQERVRKLALSCGWRYYHPWDSTHSTEGWPDVFLLRAGTALAFELKMEGKDPTEAQRDWLGALNAAGIEAWVIRPHDMDWLIEKLH